MESGASSQQLQAWYGTDADARRLTIQSLAYNTLLYVHFALSVAGLVPLWTMLLSAPILVVRWMLAVHELFHLRSEKEVDLVTRLLPLMLTPLSLGYREFLDIHRRHHRFMATPEDPEYYQLRGSRLAGFMNALSAPEQVYFRWLAYKGMDRSLLLDTAIRLLILLGMILLSGPTFLWYWVPVRLAYGTSYFSFFYSLHREGASYGVYPVKLPPWAQTLFTVLFGREALLATCHHDKHHAQPRVSAFHLPDMRTGPE
jgi:fatty acid desaturase